MLNIHGLNSLRSETKKTKKEKTKKKKGSTLHNESSSSTSSSTSFVSALNEAEETMLHEDLQKYIKAIENQGERLKRHPNKQEFIRYKSLVSRFLKKIISQSMKIKKRKVYRKDRELVSTIIIDEQLFELGRFVMLEEADTLLLAEKIDSIKGLLYDSLEELKKE